MDLFLKIVLGAMSLMCSIRANVLKNALLNLEILTVYVNNVMLIVGFVLELHKTSAFSA
jgi:hypothetical protein